MLPLKENCISLFRNAQTAPICRKPGKVFHFYTTHIIKIPRVITVAAHPVSYPAELPGNVVQIRQKALPLRWNAGAGLPRVALP